MLFKRKLLTGVSFALLSLTAPDMAWAADCTGTVTAADCTMDVDPTGEILIEDTGTLYIGADVILNYAIDSTTSASFGTISTNNGGYTIDQNAAIGSTNPLDQILINGTDIWNANADIYTNGDGDDIYLADGLAGGTLNLNNGMTYLGDINADATDTVNVGADLAGTTVTGLGAIDGAIFNVLSGTFLAEVQLGGSTPLASISVSDGATLELNNGAITDGVLDLDGSVYIGSAGTLSAATYTGADGDGADIQVGISQTAGTVSVGGLDITAGTPDYSADTLTFVMENGTEVIGASGDTINDFFTGAAGVITMPTVLDTSFLYDYSVTQSGTNLDLEITRQSLSDATTTASNLTSAQILLDTLYDTDNQIIEDIQYNLMNASTGAQFNELLESTQPSLDAASFSVAHYITNQTRTMLQRRMHKLRYAPKIKATAQLRDEALRPITATALAEAEPAAGEEVKIPGYYPIVQSGGKYVIPNKTRALAQRRLKYLKTPSKKDDAALQRQYQLAERKALNYGNKLYPYEDRPYQVWGQAFIGDGRQEQRDGLDGYTFNTAGASVGIDASSFDKRTIIGGFLTYADSEMDAGNANSTDTTMESYQIGFYGSRLLDNDHFFDLITSVSLNDIATDRFNVGGSSYTASAEYDGEFLHIGAEYGKYIEGPYDILFTPAFGAYYSRMDYESYAEKGAGGANLHVNQDALHRFDLGPSITASTHHAFENGISFIPEVDLSYNYNIMQDKMSARAYLEETAADDAEPVELTYNGFDSQDHFINLGIGANFATDRWELLTHYNYQLQEDFDGHIATLKFNYNL